jgi:hypothetical protein
LASLNPLNRVCLQWFLEEVWPLVKDRGGLGKLVISGGICDAVPEVDGMALTPGVSVAETAEDLVAAIITDLRYPEEAQKAGAAAAEHLSKMRNQSRNTLVESLNICIQLML